MEAESPDWRFECDVTLTPQELADTFRLASARRAGGSWHSLWTALGVGLACGLLAVMLRIVPAASPRAGAIAVGGFLSCWAGFWLQYAATLRAARRSGAAAWNEAGRRYQIAANPAGLQWTVTGPHATSSVTVGWGGVAEVQQCEGAVRFWTKRGNLILVPDRMLPPDWPAPHLVATVTSCIHLAEAKNPLPMGESR